MLKDWLKLGGLLEDNDFVTENLVCPECGKESIDYLFVGDKETNVGYFQIWCNNCNKGSHVSRVIIPEKAKRIEFGDYESLVKLVPNYEHVYP